MTIAFDSRNFPCMSWLRALAIFAALAFGLTLSAAWAAEPTGTWLTEKADAHIRIARCGPALCGTVVWLKDPYDHKTGKPPVDEQNPDPSKRHRPILGLRIFAMTQDARGDWSGGIYNSDDGQTYRGKLVPRGANQLEVRGCVGALCSGETWRRVGR
jgi:uncharacterized protein (DUF2147 family)